MHLFKTLAASVVISFASVAQAAPVTNGGFEDGTADWPAFAVASATGTFANVAPPEGVSQLLISSAGTNNFDGMDDFLMVPRGTTRSTFTRETLLPPRFVNRGNVVGRPITAGVGDTLTFMWCHLTTESFPETGADHSLYQIARADGSLLTSDFLGYNFRFDEFMRDFDRVTGVELRTEYRTFRYTFAEAGTFHFGLGVFDGNDARGTSFLLVDSVAITPVPEPTGLAAIGLGAVGLLRRRRRPGRVGMIA